MPHCIVTNERYMIALDKRTLYTSCSRGCNQQSLVLYSPWLQSRNIIGRPEFQQ
jgi:hypothetical protein